MKTNRLLPIFSLSIGLVLSGAALDASAQQSGAMANGQMNMSATKMDMPAQAGGTPSASTQAFEQNAANMMKNMSAPPYTGDADADFVAHMIPHHQGAVDQAKVEIKYGKDPKMKALAKNIIKAQEEEIAYMKRWQVKHHKKM
ncbi:MAG: hypothetical protein JWP38_3672 [Herbaspirillum sp.]|jgi:uncharacterized protein (DUF305 family)|nr:hypothetical protein [Herbaspirillum sp.]